MVSTVGVRDPLHCLSPSGISESGPIPNSAASLMSFAMSGGDGGLVIGGCKEATGRGGGGGGGALRIESSTSITLTGSIIANGGDGSFGSATYGGGGSGGGVHLIAPTISGAGSLRA